MRLINDSENVFNIEFIFLISIIY